MYKFASWSYGWKLDITFPPKCQEGFGYFGVIEYYFLPLSALITFRWCVLECVAIQHRVSVSDRSERKPIWRDENVQQVSGKLSRPCRVGYYSGKSWILTLSFFEIQQVWLLWEGLYHWERLRIRLGQRNIWAKQQQQQQQQQRCNEEGCSQLVIKRKLALQIAKHILSM